MSYIKHKNVNINVWLQCLTKSSESSDHITFPNMNPSRPSTLQRSHKTWTVSQVLLNLSYPFLLSSLFMTLIHIQSVATISLGALILYPNGLTMYVKHLNNIVVLWEQYAFPISITKIWISIYLFMQDGSLSSWRMCLNYICCVDLLAPEICGSDLKSIISRHIIQNISMRTRFEIVLRWVPYNLANAKLILLQLMTSCH